jgi:hypothetical protein
MLDRLGVGYKRYIVSTSLFEFRKLWFYRGSNVSPYNVNALVTSMNSNIYAFVHEFATRPEFSLIYIVDYIRGLKLNSRLYSRKYSMKFISYLRSVASLHSGILRWGSGESKDLSILVEYLLDKGPSHGKSQKLLISKSLLRSLRCYFIQSRLNSLESSITNLLTKLIVLVKNGIKERSYYFNYFLFNSVMQLREEPLLNLICCAYQFSDVHFIYTCLIPKSVPNMDRPLGFYDRDTEDFFERSTDYLDHYIDFNSNWNFVPDDVYENVIGIGLPEDDKKLVITSLSGKLRRVFRQTIRNGFNRPTHSIEKQCATIQIKYYILIWYLLQFYPKTKIVFDDYILGYMDQIQSLNKVWVLPKLGVLERE